MSIATIQFSFLVVNLNGSPARMRTTSRLLYSQIPWPTRNGVILTYQSIRHSISGASILDPCSIGTKGCVGYFFYALPTINRIQATPEGAKQGERFGLGMIGWGAATEAGAIVTGSTFRDLPILF